MPKEASNLLVLQLKMVCELLVCGAENQTQAFSIVWLGLVSVFLFFKTESHHGDRAGLKLRDPPMSDSQVLGLKACSHYVIPNSVFYKDSKCF